MLISQTVKTPNIVINNDISRFLNFLYSLIMTLEGGYTDPADQNDEVFFFIILSFYEVV
jgi:hypothetical protein